MTDVVRNTNPDLDAKELAERVLDSANESHQIRLFGKRHRYNPVAITLGDAERLATSVLLLWDDLRAERVRREKAEAMIEHVARNLDGYSPYTIRLMLRPLRTEPFTNYSDARLRAVLAGEGDTHE